MRGSRVAAYPALLCRLRVTCYVLLITFHVSRFRTLSPPAGQAGGEGAPEEGEHESPYACGDERYTVEYRLFREVEGDAGAEHVGGQPCAEQPEQGRADEAERHPPTGQQVGQVAEHGGDYYHDEDAGEVVYCKGEAHRRTMDDGR